MTPQERDLVLDLFDRLAKLESEPRDPEAERLIRECLLTAPNAVYALVQSVLVQDEALREADAYIRELEAALEGEGPTEEPKGFLDSMRERLFGEREARRGSVPQVGGAGEPMGVPPQYRSGAAGESWPATPPARERDRGSSFLGTAAAAAAGVIGGALLLSGIRSALAGQQNQSPAAGALDQIAAGGSSWESDGGGDLARQAGIEDIGGAGPREAGENRGFDFVDSAGDESDFDADIGDDIDFDPGSDY